MGIKKSPVKNFLPARKHGHPISVLLNTSTRTVDVVVGSNRSMTGKITPATARKIAALLIDMADTIEDGPKITVIPIVAGKPPGVEKGDWLTT